MNTPRARQSALLIALVVVTQTLLAWHIPSHLGDYIDPVHSIDAETRHQHDTGAEIDDTCPLGINGHGLALTGSTPTSSSCDPRARFSTPYHSTSGTAAVIAPSARDPPLQA
jgi:hypothetical protein